MIVFNETTKTYETLTKALRRGVVYYEDEFNYEYGYFNRTDEVVIVPVARESEEWRDYVSARKACVPNVKTVFSVNTGTRVAIINNDFNLLTHTLRKGQGNYPYSFNRMYEAINHFKLFKDKQEISTMTHYTLSDYMPFTFGLEFETSMGYIEEEDCFKNGLIPLRDGSISGLEYSTTVLQGDSGINLLKQQVALLDNNTEFNKECSLHVHIGNVPVTPEFIYSLYVICAYLESDLASYIPEYTFYTSKYKDTGKDYCMRLERFKDFNTLYRWATGTPYMGSLVQAHPSDPDRTAKWHITQRYYWLNLINMLCYQGPKTVEFRFLRPTYNFRIIYMWLWVLNAYILKAIEISKKLNTSNPGWYDVSDIIYNIRSLRDLIKSVYPKEIAEIVNLEMLRFEIGTINQTNNGDRCGRDVNILNKIFTGDSPLA